MLFNYFFLLPENYLLFCIFFIFCYFVFFFFSITKKYPKQNDFIIFITKLILINFFMLNFTFFSYNFGIRDIFFKDDTTNGFCLLNIILVFCFFIIISDVLKKQSLHFFEFTIFILLCLLSLNLLLSTVNLISFYLLLEFQTICFYTLAAYGKKNKYSFEAGLKYFILGSFSSILLLFGIAILYGFSGILYFEDLYIFFLNLKNTTLGIYTIFIFNFAIVLMIVGLLFKLYSFPFHFWVSDIYQGSPFAVTIFFATIPFISLFYLFIKLYFYIYFFFYENFMYFIFFSSIGSMTVGTLGGIQQKKFRRFIAYSSITGTGYYLIFFIFPDFSFIKNLFFFIFVYVINLFGLFTSFSSLSTIGSNVIIERFSLLSGLYKYNKTLAFFIVFFLFAIAGLPPFTTFIAKLFLLFNLINNKLYIFVFVMIITTILSFYYYLRISKVILYNNNKIWFRFHNLSYGTALFLVYLLFFNILLILKPSLILIPLEYILIDLF